MGATSQEQNSPFSFEILSTTNEKTSGGTCNANLQLRAILRHKLGPRIVVVARYVIRWPVRRLVSQAIGQSKEKESY